MPVRPAAIAIAAAGFGIATLLVTVGWNRLAALESSAVGVIDENNIQEALPPEEASTSSVSAE